MGRIVAPYAVKGWVRIHPFTEYLDSLLDYDVWWLGKPGAWREFRMVDGKVHGQYLLAELDGVGDRTAAEALQGLEIAVKRDEFPEIEADEYYWDDLIGLEVVNAEGVVLGKVQGLLETGAHDVLKVMGERERLIPFVEAYVREVDKAARRIQVDWGADWDLD
ncbi:MAG: ribosome maturation factor RimM [Betaproteobacteria bacterium]|nr:ribosome maturation factor RimM [Betaproteobacteria bacterium]